MSPDDYAGVHQPPGAAARDDTVCTRGRRGSPAKLVQAASAPAPVYGRGCAEVGGVGVQRADDSIISSDHRSVDDFVNVPEGSEIKKQPKKVGRLGGGASLGFGCRKMAAEMAVMGYLWVSTELRLSLGAKSQNKFEAVFWCSEAASELSLSAKKQTASGLPWVSRADVSGRRTHIWAISQ